MRLSRRWTGARSIATPAHKPEGLKMAFVLLASLPAGFSQPMF